MSLFLFLVSEILYRAPTFLFFFCLCAAKFSLSVKGLAAIWDPVHVHPLLLLLRGHFDETRNPICV